ncbi:acyltransferase family protein [Microbacterium sp. K36]|uniref:acyltransferase family protein n=1 Tax=Microbacterium sp. K36 TaxID=2305439 RepID=UPI001443DE79|nr:acyltransferase [Microbacterium sp. K36]
MRTSTVEQIAESAKRHNTFDFIRLFAALAVVVEHSVHHLDAAFLWHQRDDTLWFNGGVATFFILSGMMVYRSGERAYADGRPWRDFYRNRALRIIPAIYAYFAVLVVLLIVTGFLAPGQLLTVQFAAFAVSNLLLAPVWSPPMLDDFGVGVVNGSLWTIPVEVSFYVIVPLMVVLASRRGLRSMLVVVLIIAGISVGAYGAVGATTTESLAWKAFGVTFLPYLWWFAIGAAWSRLWSRIPQRGWMAAVAVVLYFVLAKLPLDPGPAFIANAVAAVPLSYAVIWFGYHGPKALGRFTDRLGDLSFSIYIWHMIVVNLLVSWGARSWAIDGTLLVLGVVVVTAVIAFASWHLVEKPALNRKRYTSAWPGGGEAAQRASATTKSSPSSPMHGAL